MKIITKNKEKIRKPFGVNLKKSLLIAALVLLSTLLITNNAEAKMFNRFKKGFYFEKYKTADEAKEALLKLHPIGSNVDELIRTLEKAGAVLKKRDSENYKKFYPQQYEDWKEQGNVADYSIIYDKASPFFVILNYIQWSGGVWVDKNDEITFIYFHKGRAY